MGGRPLVSLLLLALAASPAGAQPAPDEGGEIEMEGDAPADPPAAEAKSEAPAVVKDPKAARKWLTAGQQLVQKGDYLARKQKHDDAKAQYANAVTAFEKSIEVGDDLNTYYLLADAEDKLGKHDLAAKHYRVVLKAQSGIRPDVLKKATAKFDEVSTKVGMVTLTVAPEGATISLGGTEVGKAPMTEPLVLMPGTYTFSFAADGFQPKESELKVEAGSESERAIELDAVKIIVEPPEPNDLEQPQTPTVASSRSRLPLYIGGGLTIAAVGVATATGLLALGQHNTYTGATSTASERADAKTKGERFALISDAAMIGGVVAAGFTAYWYFVKYRPSKRNSSAERTDSVAGRARARREAVATKVDVAPWVQSDASGLTVLGRF